MRRIARYLYVGGAWLNMAAILFAIFAAGMMLFVSPNHRDTHISAGWGSHIPILILILTGLVGWIPRKLVAWLVAVIVVHSVQLVLPMLRADLPIVAAFHPLNAMLLAWVSWMHARAASTLIEPSRQTESSKTAPEAV